MFNKKNKEQNTLSFKPWTKLSKEETPEVISSMPYSNDEKFDEKIIEVIRQIPEFRLLIDEVLFNLTNTNKNLIDSNTYSQSDNYSLQDKIIDILREQLNNENITSDSRKMLIEGLIKISQQILDKDSENKKFLSNIVHEDSENKKLGLGILNIGCTISAAIVSSALMSFFSNKKSDN